MAISKFVLRKQFRTIRSQIPINYREQASEQAAKNLIAQTVFQNSQTIACYLAYKDEFNANPIIEAIWQAKKTCFLPVLAADDNKQLQFVEYKYGDALHLNKYSILEPINISHTIMVAQLDIVITPLLAFDLKGNRLGTGGGFYDHTFCSVNEEAHAHTILIGLGYAAQQATQIPHDPWDIRLNSVVTEKEFFEF